MLGHQLEIPPDVVGQHEDLKVGVIIFEFSRGDGIHAFSFGLRDQVFNVSSFVVLGDHLVGFGTQIGAENAVCVLIIFKQFILQGSSALPPSAWRG